jgi:hypothetical protein
MFNHGPGANHDTVSNSHSTQYADSSANPHVRSDCDGRRYTWLLVNAAIRCCSMIVIRYKAARSHHRMISNRHTIAYVELGPSANGRKIADLKARYV